MFPIYGSLSLPLIIEANVFVLVGDTYHDPTVRSDVIARIEDQLGIPTIHLNRNHDFYGLRFLKDRGEVFTIQAVRFAAASLWTYLAGDTTRRPLAFLTSSRLWARQLRGGNDLYLAHLSSVEQARADVIVTHHAPISGSVHEDFKGDVLNTFSVKNLNPERFLKTRL
jgi:hypothetical protein